MKLNSIFAFLFFCNAFVKTHAQAHTATDYFKGYIVLTDGSKLPGNIKENIRGNASLVLIPEMGGKKKSYSGNELMTVNIDSTRFLCIKGDFFKVICEGEYCFLQKASNASGKPVYNGIDVVSMSGTEGKINDYFFYNNSNQELKLVTKKSLPVLIESSFGNCKAALDKAKEAVDDPGQLKLAFDLFNSRNGK